MGEEEEAGGGGAGGWEGLRWRVRRTGDKDTSVSAILEERACKRRFTCQQVGHIWTRLQPSLINQDIP